MLRYKLKLDKCNKLKTFIPETAKEELLHLVSLRSICVISTTTPTGASHAVRLLNIINHYLDTKLENITSSTKRYTKNLPFSNKQKSPLFHYWENRGLFNLYAIIFKPEHYFFLPPLHLLHIFQLLVL